jgi:hypothetical protein
MEEGVVGERHGKRDEEKENRKPIRGRADKSLAL